MTRRGATKLALWLGIPAALVIVVAIFFSWDLCIPLVEARAAAALGRPVGIAHLHVSLGRVVRVTADDVTIGNPPDWQGEPFATARQLIADVELWPLLRHDALNLPLVAIEQPRLVLTQTADGKTNYQLQLASKSSGGATRIGTLRIDDGNVHARLVKLKADLDLTVVTQGDGDDARIVVGAKGTYGGAPITGKLLGGALLSLNDAAQPWPVDLHLANGDTTVTLVGHLRDPLHLRGADLKLQLAGQDMEQLSKLTGIPLPKTPPFRLTGLLDFANNRVQFRNFAGRVGDSDLEGTIDVDPGKQRPDVRADLRSRQVELADLGGFIGAEPGRVATPGQTPAKRAEVARAEASPKLLPDTPISLPKLQWADIHLRYRGEHIIGRSVPLDNLTVVMEIVNSAVNLHPVSFGVGAGEIRGNIALTPRGNEVHAKADLDFRRIDVSKLMAATHMFDGTGTISGTGELDATGKSLAQLLGNGNGGVRLGMVGGDLSAMLVNLSGLEFGNALLSALGVPKRTNVECLVDDMALQNGILKVQPLVVDTGEAIINGSGLVNLRSEQLDLQLHTNAKHFSIGSLPAPIDISGTLKHPSIRPGAELAARGGAAVGLGVVFPPLALLPTIQLGVGDDHRCDRVLAQAKAEPGGQRLPTPNAVPNGTTVTR